MPRIDHHIHTDRHSPDSLIDPDELIERAREVGLDGVVVTEHDYQWEEDELADLRGRAGGLVVLSGVEVSAREGHFLVYGLPDTDDVPPGIGLGKLIRVAERHGAAVIAAHPYRWDQDFDAIAAEHGRGLHALELVSNNVTPDTRRKAERTRAARRLAATGSSDAHDAEIVGCYFSHVGRPVATMADFVAALRAGAVRPGWTPGRPQAAGMVDEAEH